MIRRDFLYEEVAKLNKYKNVCESIDKITYDSLDTEYDIFLCHSSSDTEEVIKLKIYLEKQFKKVYLDKVCDQDLNFNKIDSKTAERLQVRLRNSRKLYYVLSKNSKESTWMSWELGCFNGLEKERQSLISKNEDIYLKMEV